MIRRPGLFEENSTKGILDIKANLAIQIPNQNEEELKNIEQQENESFLIELEEFVILD